MKRMGKALIICIVLALAVVVYWSLVHRVVIRYAAWNLGSEEQVSLERLLVQEFMRDNPSIKVVIDEAFVANYDGAMAAAAEQGTIPDVFMNAAISRADDNDWCRDLTDIVAKDEEWNNIPQVLRDSVYVKGKTVAVPSAMYFYGYYCNDNIFRDSGVATVSHGLTATTFAQAVEKVTDIKKGRIGLGDDSSMSEWYPAAINNRYGWFTWDGGKFNLGSREFRDGVKLTARLRAAGCTYALLGDNDKALLKGQNDWEAWHAGTVAFKFDGTWAMGDYSKLPFEVSFVGMPGGRTCIVPDYLSVAKNSAHPKEAYQFARYMSAYSEKGFSKRMELAEKYQLQVTTMPMLSDGAVLDRYFGMMDMKGIRDAYVRLSDNAYIEETKVLPGYELARWRYETNIPVGDKREATMGEVINAACSGAVDIDVVASELNYLANTCVKIYPRQLNN